MEYLQSVRTGLARLVNTAIDEKLKNDVRTTIPGYVLAFDPNTQYAEIQIGLQRLDIHGKSYRPPPIANCPVCVYGGSGGVLEVEINEGDEVLIHFSMRCIDGWRSQGGVAPLVSVERFREADAFAVLAPRSSAKKIANYSNNGMKLRSLDGTRHVWLKKDGSIEVLSTIDAIVNGATITTGGNVITAAGTDLDAFKAEYDAHKHNETGSQTSTPV